MAKIQKDTGVATKTLNNSTNTAPPQGQYITSAVMYNKSSDGKTDTNEEGILGNFMAGIENVYVTVLARDTYTGEDLIIDNVRVKTDSPMLVKGLSPNERFTLTAVSYEDFKRKNVSAMSLTAVGRNPVLQNEAIPEPVKMKNAVDSFSMSPQKECKKFNEKYENVKKMLGMVHSRDDLVILQGNANGRSPGVIVHQGDGTLIMFDNTGKQYTMMHPSTGFVVNSANIDIGQANENKDHLGVPMQFNKVNNTVPQGTILTPQPWLIPNIAKFLALSIMIVDIVDLTITCGDAVYTILNDK